MVVSKRRTSGSKSRFWTTAVPLLLVTWILVVAYYMNNPTPDGLCNPWKYRTFVAVKRIGSDAAYVMSFFTSSNYIQIFRSLVDYVSLMKISQPEVWGSNIRSSVTIFDGVEVRLYEPIIKRAVLGPALVFMHGGAFVIGSTVMYDGLTRRFAEELDCMVVSVEYRLAPEHPFPAGFEDCLKATKWFMDHAQDYGVDRSRIGVSGDSAGGALAAAVTQFLHDDPGHPDMAFQALIYPITQLVDNHTPGALRSISLFGEEGAIVTWQEAGEFTCCYLLGKLDDRVIRALIDNTYMSVEFRRDSPLAQYVNHTLLPPHMRDYGHFTPPHHKVIKADDVMLDQINTIAVDQRASPLLRPNMTGLPPTFIGTCEFDPLRDHGAFYAQRLRDASVPVTWEHYHDGFHGVLGPTWPLVFEVGEKMFQDLIVFSREHLRI